jgi:hypothetical protein
MPESHMSKRPHFRGRHGARPPTINVYWDVISLRDVACPSTQRKASERVQLLMEVEVNA